MQVAQVNRGDPARLKVGGREIETGIFKRPVAGRVAVGECGLEDDAVCDSKHHGGPDQAVYLYSREDYAWWSAELDRDVPFGMFGENLTTSGLDLNAVRVGDRLIADDLELQVTAPRIPCSTLAARMGDSGFARRFMAAARSGAYCRVLRQGTVGQGDPLTLERFDGDSIPLPTFFAEAHAALSRQRLEEYLALPIDARTRDDFRKKLAKLS